jgi:Zn-dependent protease
MKSALPIGRLAGVELYLHSTFPLILLWTFWQGSQEGGAGMGITRSLLVLVLFACVALHELGHSLVARIFGIGTRRIVLYPIGGVAALDRIPTRPHQELLMALGGPAVNLVIAIVLALVGGGWPAWVELGAAPVTPRLWAVSLIGSNLGLALFNLIPAFPMDGGRVFRSLLAFVLPAHRATQIAYGLGLVLAAGLAFLGLRIGNPFLVIIAVFIGAAGRQENRAATLRYRLDRQVIDDLRQPARTVPMEATLADCMRQSEPGQTGHFLVVSQGRLVGLLPDLHWRAALKTAGPDAPVRNAMVSRFVAVAPTVPLSELAILARQSPQPFYPVVANGAPDGIVTTADLAHLILKSSPARKPSPSRWRLDLG